MVESVGGCIEIDPKNKTEEDVEEALVDQTEGLLSNQKPDNELNNNGVGDREKSDKNQSVVSTGEKDEEMEESEKSDSNELYLFRLVVVNSYGSQEVQKLEPSKSYKLSSELFSSNSI